MLSTKTMLRWASNKAVQYCRGLSTSSTTEKFISPRIPAKHKIAEEVEELMNAQMNMEAESSHFYLSCASIAEQKKMAGVANFFYVQANEEKNHMIKLMKFINVRGGEATLTAITTAAPSLMVNGSIKSLFSNALELEETNTRNVNHLLECCIQAKDHITHQFLQWYAAEQVEEEDVFKSYVDKLYLIGDDSAGIYSFDRDLSTFIHKRGEDVQKGRIWSMENRQSNCGFW